MRAILLLLKITETLLCLSCMVVHIIGIVNPDEPMYHELFFCGIYFGFWLWTMAGCVSFCMGIALNIFMEAAINLLGGIFFVIAAIVAMAHAENDNHLMYLTDDEERQHPFFYISRLQSALSILAGISFIRNFLLIMDMLIIVDHDGNDSGNINLDHRSAATKPLKLRDFPSIRHTTQTSRNYCKQYFKCFSYCTIEKRNDRNIDRTF